MRKIVLSIFVVASLLSISCSKNSPGGKKSILGKWKLVQIATFAPRFVFQDYVGEPAFITFHSNGTVTGSPGIVDTVKYKRYVILNDSMLLFPPVQGLDTARTPYSIERNMLITTSVCGFEPCLKKFRKVN